ncbi:unnamed protein product [Leptidea sinapis]|uniref:Uncharacterized protein n=1 Tax=Leptidea sinapis TaxID=189913 RepID=A0A5E4Q7G4_9NEOP|nr:unnamed protein product [Leptidea sinapis]
MVTSYELAALNYSYGFLILYYHYFEPKSIIIYPSLHEIKLQTLKDLIDENYYETLLLKPSRRWLPEGEIPYPGYCRAPGGEKCLPVLCNCKKLLEIWMKIKDKQKNYNGNNH